MTVQIRAYVIPVEPGMVSFPVAMPVHGDTVSCSNLSWANVEASVMCPPKELFLVVVAINPARANRAMAKMNNAIITSIIEKPLDPVNLNVTPS